MTQGNPLQLIVLFALPLMAGNVFQQLYTVTDTAIVGRAIGVEALAALGAVDWLNWMVLGVIQGVTQGFSILIAQKYGSKEYEKMRKVIGNSCTLCAFCAVALCVAAQLAVNPAVALLKAPEQITPLACAYLRVIFWGIPVMMIYNMVSSILRALGDSRTPLYAMIAASAANIALDMLFVLVFRWGVQGAAAATVLTQVLASAYCIAHIRKISLLKMDRSDFKPEKQFARRLVTLAVPMAFQNGIIAVGGMIVQAVVNGFGVAFIAGFTATNKLYGLLEIAATSYGYAVTTYVGQNYGAMRLDRVKAGMRSATGLAIGTSIVIAAVMLLFGRPITMIFISREDPALALAAGNIAYWYLCAMAISLPVLYLLYVYQAGLQGMGNTVVPMLSGMLEFALRVSLSFVVAYTGFQYGIFGAEVSAWWGAAIFLILGYLHHYRKILKKA